jgi:iron complex transport system substrate-binding protein
MFKSLLTYLLVAILLSGCNQNSEKNKVTSDHIPSQNPIPLSYAKGFTIDTINGGLQRIIVKDLLNNTSVGNYILVPKGYQYAAKENETIIYTPLASCGIFSSSYVGFLNELAATNIITTVENSNYIYHPEILKRIANGNIQEIGSTGQLNLEKLLLAAPEALLISASTSGLSSEFEKAKEAGIPSIICSEWQEHHPLARAEWIKFYGALLDQEAFADTLFNVIEDNYHSTIGICASATSQPKVLFSAMYQDTWYIPGGKSYVAQLLKDANGTYAWVDNSETGSLTLSFENVASKSLTHDIWINPEVNSLNELLSRDGRYQNFIDNNSSGIFQQNAKTNDLGGNDYWETGVVRADWVLQDYAKMMHPELFENTNFTFFTPIQ